MVRTRFSVAGTPERSVAGIEPGEEPIQWADDGAVYVWQRGEVPAAVYRLDLKTGVRASWNVLSPNDSSGMISYTEAIISRDARSYAYGFTRALTSDLYLVEGWK